MSLAAESEVHAFTGRGRGRVGVKPRKQRVGKSCDERETLDESMDSTRLGFETGDSRVD